jgi:hypothetical protein
MISYINIFADFFPDKIGALHSNCNLLFKKMIVGLGFNKITILFAKFGQIADNNDHNIDPWIRHSNVDMQITTCQNVNILGFSDEART